MCGFSGRFGIAAQAAKSSARSSTTTSMLFVAGEGAELRILKSGFRIGFRVYLGHFQVGSYRYRSLIEGLYT